MRVHSRSKQQRAQLTAHEPTTLDGNSDRAN